MPWPKFHSWSTLRREDDETLAPHEEKVHDMVAALARPMVSPSFLLSRDLVREGNVFKLFVVGT